jgi:hypothetical protein
MNKWVLYLLLILSPILAKSQALNQTTDFSILSHMALAKMSIVNSTIDSAPSNDKPHSPKKATIYSALLPGLGQAYNHKYWKIPLIYAGLGATFYFAKVNRDSMRVYQNALKLLLDTNRNTNPVAYYYNQPITQLRATRNQLRTNRDYSIIGFAGIYLINIVDAAIDAHFYNFNIDKPLAMQKTRHIYLVSGRVQSVPAFGLAYRF